MSARRAEPRVGVRRRAATVAMVALLTLAPLERGVAQSPDDLPARLSPAARTAIARLLDSARVAGLPLEPLVAKAQEGVLKGAEDGRIVAAVRTIAHGLAEAREALGSDAPSGTLVAAAGALHAGLDARQLRAIRDEAVRASPASLSQALVVAGDLVSRGVASSEATSSLIALIVRRATDADLETMRRLVERDIETGILPREAVAVQSRAITQRLDQQRGIPRPP